ncbi:HlyD family efflux transporter periplasmic adaptor subunit [Effusibacillus consociatus]|uniref:HlyD family efflux transporter periplasmic adaptor subunit n=1 Tax=Effusibacillus consociatus TaxID=1117041 RepID=A0ABV9Q905_9BACL
MKAIIKDFSELTDSRELYEARPNPVISFFMYILMALITIAFLWAYFGEKEIVVKAAGVVRPNDSVSSIRNKVLGKVERVYVKAGQSVKQGGLLFALEKEDLEVQKKALMDQLEESKENVALLDKFKKGVEEGNNYFSRGVKGEQEFHERLLKYQLDSQSLKTELESTGLNLSQNKSSYSSKIVEIEDTLHQLRLLERSILQNQNLFSEVHKEYFNKYVDYEMKIKKLKNAVDQKKKSYETMKTVGDEVFSRQQIENEKNQLELAQLELDSYQNEYLLAIREKMEEHEKQLVEYKKNLRKTNQDDYLYSNSRTVALQKLKMDTLVGINEQIKNEDEKIKQLEEQLKSVELHIQEREIKSPIDGIVNVTTEVSKGDLIQTGTELATIIPENNSQYKIQLSLPNKNIAKIKEGDRVRYHFLALPFDEYGELTGTITKIAKDAILKQETGESFYLAEATLDNKPLHSYKGQEATIKVGMITEAYIVTESKKILYYLLEKIDLRD